MRFTLAALTLALALAGCSSGSGSDEDPAAAPSTSTTATTSPSSEPTPTTSTTPTAPPTSTPTPTADPTPTGPEANCLFTVAQVSRVLGGRWTRTPQAAQPCAYNSDRGAVAISQVVAGGIESGLRDARAACVEGVKPVTLRRGRLIVCVERNDQVGQVVVGNVVSRGQLWLVLVPAPGDDVPAAQLEAMLALVQTVPA